MFQIVFAGGGEEARLQLTEMLSPFVRPVPAWKHPGRRLLFLPEGGLPPEGLLRRGDTAIVSAESPGQLKQLSRMPVQAIVCGLSSKDTVTFSSREESRAAVSLLREIRGWDGRTVEPMELLVEVPGGCGDYLVLAAAAAAMYFGIPPDHLRKFTSYKTKRPAYNTKANAEKPNFRN